MDSSFVYGSIREDVDRLKRRMEEDQIDDNEEDGVGRRLLDFALRTSSQIGGKGFMYSVPQPKEKRPPTRPSREDSEWVKNAYTEGGEEEEEPRSAPKRVRIAVRRYEFEVDLAMEALGRARRKLAHELRAAYAN